MFKATVLWWGVEIKDYVYQQICKLTDSKKIDNHRFLLLVSGGIDSQVLLSNLLLIKKTI